MKYLLIKFTAGWDFQAYQEVSEDGRVSNVKDLDGNLIASFSDPAHPFPFPIEAEIIDENPPRPTWAL